MKTLSLFSPIQLHEKLKPPCVWIYYLILIRLGSSRLRNKKKFTAVSPPEVETKIRKRPGHHALYHIVVGSYTGVNIFLT
jgi:hypothetical protein